MDLEAEYNRVKARLKVIDRELEKMEDDGLYGSVRYNDMMEEESNLSQELQDIEDEMDR